MCSFPQDVLLHRKAHDKFRINSQRNAEKLSASSLCSNVRLSASQAVGQPLKKLFFKVSAIHEGANNVYYAGPFEYNSINIQFTMTQQNVRICRNILRTPHNKLSLISCIESGFKIIIFNVVIEYQACHHQDFQNTSLCKNSTSLC